MIFNRGTIERSGQLEEPIWQAYIQGSYGW